jgi:hypothetical protein
MYFYLYDILAVLQVSTVMSPALQLWTMGSI